MACSSIIVIIEDLHITNTNLYARKKLKMLEVNKFLNLMKRKIDAESLSCFLHFSVHFVPLIRVSSEGFLEWRYGGIDLLVQKRYVE